MNRIVIVYKRYFLDFYEIQNSDVQKKIEWTLNLIQVKSQIPEKYFKHLEGTVGLFEIRVEVSGNIFRIFCFSTKEILWCLEMDFKKRLKKHQKKKLKRL
jgi:hypothetical protein